MAYIEREKAFEAITDFAGTATTKAAYSAFWKSAKVLNTLPTADVEEVVRCKNCKHLDRERFCVRGVDGTGYKVVLPDDFCSYGERSDT